MAARTRRDYQRWARRGTTEQRGYGSSHRALRERRLLLYRPGDPCAIGGEPLTVAARWLDLAHDHVNGGYLGLACRRHNRGEGATRGNRMRGPLPRAQRRAVAFKTGRWR